MSAAEEAQRKYNELRAWIILLLEEMENDLECGTEKREADFNNHKIVGTRMMDEDNQEFYTQWTLDGKPADAEHLVNDLLDLPRR